MLLQPARAGQLGFDKVFITAASSCHTKQLSAPTVRQILLIFQDDSKRKQHGRLCIALPPRAACVVTDSYHKHPQSHLLFQQRGNHQTRMESTQQPWQHTLPRGRPHRGMTQTCYLWPCATRGSLHREP